MKIAVLPLLLLIAGCSDSGGDAPEKAEAPVPVTARGLTGLYESAAGETSKSQMCIVQRGEEAQFGFVIWGANAHSCSATGTAQQDGTRLTLSMAGDSECAIDAQFADGIVTFPAAVPDGCAYYCGARARMNGTVLNRVANTPDDALKAKDLVGDPLCEGM